MKELLIIILGISLISTTVEALGVSVDITVIGEPFVELPYKDADPDSPITHE